MQHAGAVVVGFAAGPCAAAAAPFVVAPAKPRSLLSELLYEAQQYEMMEDTDSDGFLSSDDEDMQTEDAAELCELCQQMSASSDASPGSSPIAIPSAT